MFRWFGKRNDARVEHEVVQRPAAREKSSRKKEVYVRTRALPQREESTSREGWGRNGLPSYNDVERLIGIYAATGEGQGAFFAAQEAIARERGPSAAYGNPATYGSPATYGTEAYHPRPSAYQEEIIILEPPTPQPLQQQQSRPPRPETSTYGPPPRPHQTGAQFAAVRRRSRRRTRLHHQTEYEDVEHRSDEEEDEHDGLKYADLPPVEDDVRLRSRTDSSRKHERKKRESKKHESRSQRPTTYDRSTIYVTSRSEPTVRETAPQGPSGHEPTVREAAPQGPSVRETTARRAAPQGRSTRETRVRERTVVREPSEHEPAGQYESVAEESSQFGRQRMKHRGGAAHEPDYSDSVSRRDEYASSRSRERDADSETPRRRSPRLRGGAADTDRRRSSYRRDTGPSYEIPTRTSAYAKGTLRVPLDELDTEPRKINLVFFCIIRGKIVLSSKPEVYTTFLELQEPPIRNPEQQYDSWFVEKLQDQYCIITREARGFFINSLLVRTIGFANFLRFERTVHRRQDPLGYVLTAKASAVDSRTEPTSQFQYQMRHPSNFKSMLVILDRLVALADEDRPSFYMVEIKEALDTGKIYRLFFLLVLTTTGGGTAFAVIKGQIATGLSIASYALTCLSLTLGLVSAGQWLGLTKPSAFSFAYDVEDNQFLGVTNLADAGPSQPNYSRFAR